MYLWHIREDFRTGRKKNAEGVQLSETTLPELKRARQTANVTAGVWSRDSLTFAATRIQKQTWI